MLLNLSFLSFAVESGVNTSTKINLNRSSSTVFSTGERLDGWWKVPFGVNGSVFEGSAHFDGSLYSDDDPALSSTEKTTVVPTGDIDRVRAAFVFPSLMPAIKTLNFELGRLKFNDKNGLIVSHPADGVKLGIDLTYLTFNFQTGYTTLILRKSNGINLSLYDQDAKSDKSRIFGNSRLLVQTGAEFPDVYGQSINVSFIAQQDLAPNSRLIPEWSTEEYFGMESRGGLVNTQYTTLDLNGQIINNLFYSTFATYGSGKTLTWLKDNDSPTGYSYQYVPISSVLAGLTFDYFMPSFLNSSFNFRFLYASGDNDYSRSIEGNTSGTASQFIPLTASPLGNVFSPKLSNLVVAQLGGSLKPVSSQALQTGVKCLAFFRPTYGPVNVSGLLPGSNASWLGFEADLYGMYRIMSDLGLSLNTGIFLPGITPNGAFSTGTAAVQYSINLSIAVDL